MAWPTARHVPDRGRPKRVEEPSTSHEASNTKAPAMIKALAHGDQRWRLVSQATACIPRTMVTTGAIHAPVANSRPRLTTPARLSTVRAIVARRSPLSGLAVLADAMPPPWSRDLESSLTGRRSPAARSGFGRPPPEAGGPFQPAGPGGRPPPAPPAPPAQATTARAAAPAPAPAGIVPAPPAAASWACLQAHRRLPTPERGESIERFQASAKGISAETVIVPRGGRRRELSVAPADRSHDDRPKITRASEP